MGLDLSAESWQVLGVFLCYLIGVAALGLLSHRLLTRGSFVKEYFLGNRGLGPWVLALTVAATAISGGTFMGFPSLIYTNGWVMALWICGYMVVPLMTMALMGKRINQVARMSGAVTVPDVLRDRFHSPALGLLSTSVILVLLTVNLVAQFKAGAIVMQEAMQLPPARAELAKTVEDAAEKVLEVHFTLADGGTAVQKTAFPTETATFLPEKTEHKPRTEQLPEHVLVYFDVGGEVKSKRVNFPAQTLRLPVTGQVIDKGYLIGLLIFAFTVVAYTTYGGFWAVTMTDVLEGLVMLGGVLLMAVLALQAVPPVTVARTPPVVAGQAQPAAVVHEELRGLPAATETLRQRDPDLVVGPGPKNFLPLGAAFSFFLMWSLMGAGNPSGMVRLMSFKDSASLRRALLLVSGYYILTYVALLVIFICARAIFPIEYLRESGSEALGEPDRIMPAMARKLTEDRPWLGGLLLAAPYAAIMSTVAAFLLMISSSLVRDIYQRSINTKVSDRTIKISSYLLTALVGVVVMVGALNPPAFLQYIIVFTGSGLGCTFLAPMLLTLYWRRATRAGVLAAMLGGMLTVVSLYVLGWLDSGSAQALRQHAEAVRHGAAAEAPAAAQWLRHNLAWVPGWGEERPDAFNPLFVGGVDALVWGLLVSAVLGVAVSLVTRPDEELVKKYFP